jgi:hypothetical protein
MAGAEVPLPFGVDLDSEMDWETRSYYFKYTRMLVLGGQSGCDGGSVYSRLLWQRLANQTSSDK